MIHVTENGAPVVAIARVEIDEARERKEQKLREYVKYVRMVGPPLPPLLKLPMSEAEARRLRDEWVKQWPEVASFLHKR